MSLSLVVHFLSVSVKCTGVAWIKLESCKDS